MGVLIRLRESRWLHPLRRSTEYARDMPVPYGAHPRHFEPARGQMVLIFLLLWPLRWLIRRLTHRRRA